MKNLIILTILLSITFTINAQTYKVNYNENVATVICDGVEKEMAFYSDDDKLTRAKDIGEENIINLMFTNSLLLKKTNRSHYSDKSFPKTDIVESQLWAIRIGDNCYVVNKDVISGTQYPIFYWLFLLICLCIYFFNSRSDFFKRKEYKRIDKLGETHTGRKKAAMKKYRMSLRISVTTGILFLIIFLITVSISNTTYGTITATINMVLLIFYPFINFMVANGVSDKIKKIVIP